MKVLVEVEDKDVFLLVGVAHNIGFVRADKREPADVTQDAIRHLFQHFLNDLKLRVLDKMSAQLEIAEKINASNSIRIKK